MCCSTFTSMTESTEVHGPEFVAAVCMSTHEHLERSVQPVRDRIITYIELSSAMK